MLKKTSTGRRGCRRFITPPPHEMMSALGNPERFLHNSDDLDPLIVCALAHAQFETIRPFLDGNGRVGRLLVTFLLCHAKVLQRPVLYLSHYLKQHRATYYDRLMAVRMAGDWEGWLRFFLTGVGEVAREVEQTARSIVQLRERASSARAARLSSNVLALLNYLFERPLITVNTARERLNISLPAANGMIGELSKIGLLKEVTGGRRNRMFRFDPYLDLFTDVSETTASLTETQPTRSQEPPAADRLGMTPRQAERAYGTESFQASRPPDRTPGTSFGSAA